MLRYLFLDASWVLSWVSRSDNQKPKAADVLRRAALASVEALESRQLLSAGQLDPSFGAGGALLFPASGAVYASAVQGDGKILLVGGSEQLLGTYLPVAAFYVERLNPNGTVDSTFGTNGIVDTEFPYRSAATSVVIQPDGKIIVGGKEVETGSRNLFELARYNTNGTLDASFGSGGKVISTFPGLAEFQSLALAPDGKIIAAGQSSYLAGTATDGQAYFTTFTVARYNTDGTLDTTFASAGVLNQQIPERNNDYVTGPGLGLAAEPDGKIIVGSNFKTDPALWRFNVDGTPDRTFGQAGVAMLPIAAASDPLVVNAATIGKLIIQPDGKILAGGPAHFNDPELDYLMERFDADGSVDKSFGDSTISPAGGAISIALGNGNSDVRLYPDTLLQPDGKIVVAGSEAFDGVVVNRYTASGAADSSFQFAKYMFGSDSLSGECTSINLTPDGNIILVDNPRLKSTSVNVYNVADTGLLRIQDNFVSTTATLASTTNVNIPAGGIDLSFGIQGKTAIADPTTVWTFEDTQRTARAMALQADGKMLIAGSVGTVKTDGIGQLFVTRLDADGSIDSTFGAGGFVQTAVGNFATANAMVVQPDGKIVVAGGSQDSQLSPTNVEFVLVRYNADGTLDSTFGTGGIVTTDFAGNEQINALSLDGNTIVAAGSYYLNPDIGFHVARYLASGVLDTSFNATGELTTDLGPPTPYTTAFATSLLVLQNGALAIGSHSGVHAAVYKYNSDGAPTTSLGYPSNVTVNPGVPGFTALAGTVTAMTELSGGQVMAASVEQDAADTAINLFQVGAAGGVATGYGNNGVAVIRFADDPGLAATDESSTLAGGDPTYVQLYNVALVSRQGDNSVVVVGSRPTFDRTGAVTGPIGLRPLVERFNPDGSLSTSFVDSADPNFMPPPYYRGEVVGAAVDSADGTILVAADNFAARTNNWNGFHDVSSPHWIGVTAYATDAKTVSIPVPVSGSDFTPTAQGGSGIPLPAGQLSANATGALPVRVIGGARGVVRVLIKNSGTTSFSGPVTIGVYASTDSTISADDALLGTITLPRISLKRGATRSVAARFTYGADRPAGQYRILTSVTEVAQGTAAFFALQKQSVRLVKAVADLSLAFVPAKPEKLRAGKKAHLVLQIKNLGNVTAVGTYSIVLQGSADAVKAPSDPVLATRTIKSFRLPVKGVRRVTLDFNQLASLGSTYTLIATGSAITAPPDSNGAHEVIELAATVS